jgi:Protein of Unknown function (DUF2784)
LGARSPRRIPGRQEVVYQFLADLLLIIHFAFILLVVVGGLVALHYRRLVLLHLPALIWGVYVELSGSICPLTPWENRLRQLAGDEGYSGSFIEHYLLPLIYPQDLTRELQVGLGVLLAAINALVYAVLIYRYKRFKR